MVAFNLFIAALVAVSVTARPVTLLQRGDATGFGSPAGLANQQKAAQNQKTAFAAAATTAAAAEAAAGINIAAAIASASSVASSLAAAATAAGVLARPDTLSPEQAGEVAGLREKLNIDINFKDTGAIAADNEAIESAITHDEELP